MTVANRWALRIVLIGVLAVLYTLPTLYPHPALRRQPRDGDLEPVLDRMARRAVIACVMPCRGKSLALRS